MALAGEDSSTVTIDFTYFFLNELNERFTNFRIT